MAKRTFYAPVEYIQDWYTEEDLLAGRSHQDNTVFVKVEVEDGTYEVETKTQLVYTA